MQPSSQPRGKSPPLTAYPMKSTFHASPPAPA